MREPEDDHVDIRVNGQQRRIEAAPDSPLLYALRNELGLTSPRFGCGLGRCGACTVLRDGEPIFSCITPVGDIGDSAITTLEGIGTEEQPRPLQQAFLDEQAAQCGYCIPGILMTTAGLLEHNGSPTPDEIREALDGHLCRCGAHVRILRAIERVTRDAE